MKIRIALEIPGEHDLSPILEAAQVFACELAASVCEDEIECVNCAGRGSDLPGVDCPECDGVGSVARDYDDPLSEESAKITDTVSVERLP